MTADMPDPDLLIRTGGEMRMQQPSFVGGWPTAKYISLTFFRPDFTKDDFLEALLAYQKRDRRIWRELGI